MTCDSWLISVVTIVFPISALRIQSHVLMPGAHLLLLYHVVQYCARFIDQLSATLSF